MIIMAAHRENRKAKAHHGRRSNERGTRAPEKLTRSGSDAARLAPKYAARLAPKFIYRYDIAIQHRF